MSHLKRKRNACKTNFAITKMTKAPPTPVVADWAAFMQDREQNALVVIRAAVEESQATISRVVREQMEELDWHKAQILSDRTETN